jgi:hypothetical protein
MCYNNSTIVNIYWHYRKLVYKIIINRGGYKITYFVASYRVYSPSLSLYIHIRLTIKYIFDRKYNWCGHYFSTNLVEKLTLFKLSEGRESSTIYNVLLKILFSQENTRALTHALARQQYTPYIVVDIYRSWVSSDLTTRLFHSQGIRLLYIIRLHYCARARAWAYAYAYI